MFYTEIRVILYTKKGGVCLKGKYSTPMNSIEYIKKAKPIPCDCARCYYSKRTSWGSLYCENRDEFDINITKCRYYWCTKPPQKSKKSKKKKKDKHNR